MTEMSIEYQRLRNEVMADPATHNWVRELIPVLESKDPCDVAGDLELLSELARLRLDGLLAVARARMGQKS